jgi:hypothetical protein
VQPQHYGQLRATAAASTARYLLLGGGVVDVVLGCNALWADRWTPTCRNIMLPPFKAEYEDGTFLRNVGIYLLVQKALQPIIPTSIFTYLFYLIYMSIY